MNSDKLIEIDVDRLVLPERNARRHTMSSLYALSNSIRDFGFRVPVIIDKNDIVIAGNGRVRAARHLGLKEVLAVRVERWSEVDAREYAIVDNLSFEGGEVDTVALGALLERVSACDAIDMERYGFDAVRTVEVGCEVGEAVADADDGAGVEQEVEGDDDEVGGDEYDVICGGCGHRFFHEVAR